MTEDQKKNLETQLCGIANLLQGKVSTDDYRDYILSFIFFKYLSKKQQKIADCLSSMDQSIDKLKNQIEQTIQFRKGLLQRIFV